jgi:hypothetical protein
MMHAKPDTSDLPAHYRCVIPCIQSASSRSGIAPCNYAWTQCIHFDFQKESVGVA